MNDPGYLGKGEGGESNAQFRPDCIYAGLPFWLWSP